jgi:hypothetical protein
MTTRSRAPSLALGLFALVVIGIVAVVGVGQRGTSPAVAASGLFRPGGVCLPRVSPDQLDRLFDTEPGGVVGADYQRTTMLPDGRVLWTFQDAEVRLPNGATTLVHNIGMIQSGTCFTVLMSGSAVDPQPWLFASETARFSRWFWPLGAEMGADGRLYVFAAEMVELGPGYLTRTEPVATAVAGVDAGTLAVQVVGRPPNAGTDLYGWSIESDTSWTYLYAQCHRQFGFDPYIFVLAHDQQCSNRVTLARVPRGRLFDAPTYWTGRGWSADPAAAVPVIDTTNRMVNASQIIESGNNWMSITKVDDWWGDRILVERADRPTGPFSVVAEIAAVSKCPVDCNTYFASWVPATDPGLLFYGLSHNRWDGVATAVYRPTFAAIGAPAPTMALADRCSLGHCG